MQALFHNGDWVFSVEIDHFPLSRFLPKELVAMSYSSGQSQCKCGFPYAALPGE